MAVDSFITLHTARSIHRVLADSIVCVHCDSYICEIVLDNGTTITTAKPLCYYEDTLPKAVFVKINRNYLVNVNHIVEIRLAGARERTCYLSNGKELSISYRRWPGLKQLILK